MCRKGSPTNTPTPARSGGMDRRRGRLALGSTYRWDPGWKLMPTASAPAAAQAATSAGVVTPQILTRRGCIQTVYGRPFVQARVGRQRRARLRERRECIELTPTSLNVQALPALTQPGSPLATRPAAVGP